MDGSLWLAIWVRHEDDTVAAHVPIDILIAVLLDDRELTQEHLISSQASVRPGIQIKEDAFPALELRIAVNHADAIADLTAHFLDHDSALGDLTLDDFLNFYGYVGINPIVGFIDGAFN